MKNSNLSEILILKIEKFRVTITTFCLEVSLKIEIKICCDYCGPV